MKSRFVVVSEEIWQPVEPERPAASSYILGVAHPAARPGISSVLLVHSEFPFRISLLSTHDKKRTTFDRLVFISRGTDPGRPCKSFLSALRASPNEAPILVGPASQTRAARPTAPLPAAVALHLHARPPPSSAAVAPGRSPPRPELLAGRARAIAPSPAAPGRPPRLRPRPASGAVLYWISTVS